MDYFYYMIEEAAVMAGMSKQMFLRYARMCRLSRQGNKFGYNLHDIAAIEQCRMADLRGRLAKRLTKKEGLFYE